MSQNQKQETHTSRKHVNVVIGANFGDEGKGLMTDYFCQKAAFHNERCLVICHNGGSQRGHTVVTQNGIRHVFHHFGSGSFSGADTYLSEDFIGNPMVFRKEWEELEQAGCIPNVWMHPHCRITTPFDMIFNQLAEEQRSNQRHGSCGMGIFETLCRYKEIEKQKKPFGLQELINAGKNYLCQIRDEYFPKRLETLGIVMDEEWKSIISQEGLITHYLEDLEFMKQRVKFTEISVFNHYDRLVFEGGQGLLLDQDNQEYFPHLTPSSTGLKNPSRLLNQWIFQHNAEKSKKPSLKKSSVKERSAKELSVEVCYVTRPYLTRHGAGRLDLECNKEEINADMVDKTNQPNPYQGMMRYGKVNIHHLKERISRDFEHYKGENWKCCLAITHRNEVEDYFVTDDQGDVQAFMQEFDGVYFSEQESLRYSLR